MIVTSFSALLHDDSTDLPTPTRIIKDPRESPGLRVTIRSFSSMSRSALAFAVITSWLKYTLHFPVHPYLQSAISCHLHLRQTLLSHRLMSNTIDWNLNSLAHSRDVAATASQTLRDSGELSGRSCPGDSWWWMAGFQLIRRSDIDDGRRHLRTLFDKQTKEPYHHKDSALSLWRLGGPMLALPLACIIIRTDLLQRPAGSHIYAHRSKGTFI
jgi:hypothetical protein